jgi:alanine racemase
MRVALLAAGYASGRMRELPNQKLVLVQGPETAVKH